MGSAALPLLLLVVLLVFSWRLIFVFNRDLVRSRAWKDLSRRGLPFAGLTIMALTMFPVQATQDRRALFVWLVCSAVVVVLANTLAIPRAERAANKAFRQRDYEKAVEEYHTLAEERPLARHHAFLAAALGANGEPERSLEESNKAVELDPKYGLAYYNRALVLKQMGHRGRAKKDLNRALEADLPRRLKSSARDLLEELS